MAGSIFNTRPQDVDMSMLAAASTTPDAHAKVMDMSFRLKVAPDVVARNPQWAERQLNQTIDSQALIKSHPATAKYLADPNNASVSRDEIIQQMAIEDTLRDAELLEPGLFGKDVRDTLVKQLREKGRNIEFVDTPSEWFKSPLMESSPGAAQAGMANAYMGMGGMAGTYVPVMPEQMAPAPADKAEPPKPKTTELPTKPMGAWERLASGAAKGEQIPFFAAIPEIAQVAELTAIAHRIKDKTATDDDWLKLLEYDAEMRRGTTFGGQVAGILSQLPAFAGEFAATGGVYTAGRKAATGAGLYAAKKLLNKSAREVAESAVLRSTVKLTGLAVGSAARATVGMPQRVALDTMQRLVPQMQFTEDEQGQIEATISEPNDGFASALGKAILNQSIEVGTESAGAFIGKITGLNAVKAAVMTRWFKLNPTSGWSQFQALLKKGGWDGILEEFGEERLGDILRAATGLEKLKIDPEQYMAEMVAFAALPVGGMAVSLPSMIRYSNQSAQRAQAQVDFFNELGQQSLQSKTRERVPGLLSYLGTLATQDGPVESVFHPVASWDAYWASKQVDPRQATIDLLGSAEAYDSAKATGHDIEIPLASYVEKIAPTEHNAAMSQELRLGSAEAPNVREMTAGTQAVQQQMQELLKLNQDFESLTAEQGTVSAEIAQLEQQIQEAQAAQPARQQRLQEIAAQIPEALASIASGQAAPADMQALVSEYQSLQEQESTAQAAQQRIQELGARQQEITAQVEQIQQRERDARQTNVNVAPEVRAMADTTFDTLMSTGRYKSERAARAHAAIYSRMAYVQALRNGMTLEEFNERFPLEITNGEATTQGASLSQEDASRDAEYMAAVETGDMETAQRLVNEAAKAAGYNTVPLYHGTASSWTSPRTPIFLADEKTAKAYAADRSYSLDKEEGDGVVFKFYTNFKRTASEDDVKQVASELGIAVENDQAFSVIDPSIAGKEKSARIVNALKKIGYDSAKLYDFSPADFDEVSSYVAFDPSQIKSADPVTRDADGNVIPLSERFNPRLDSILFQQQRDAQYLAAVEAGDMETAQRLVDEAAKAAGYTVGPVYHGTSNEFDVFKPRTAQGWGTGVYFASDRSSAEEYGPRIVTAVLKINRPFSGVFSSEDEGKVEQTNAYKQAQQQYKNNPRFIDDETGKLDWRELYQESGSFAGDLVRDLGYDAVVQEESPHLPSGSEIVVFDPSQIKSAEPVTRDADGSVIPLSERFNPEQDSILYQSEPSEQVIDAAPVITMQDLVGRYVFPIIADLTSAGKLYRGIDSTEIAMPIYTQGGPGFPLLPENVGAGVAWASQGSHVANQKAARAGQKVLGIVTAMEQNAHASNATAVASILATVQAYATSGRMTSEQVDALDELIRTQGPIAEQKAIAAAAEEMKKAQDRLKKAQVAAQKAEASAQKADTDAKKKRAATTSAKAAEKVAKAQKAVKEAQDDVDNADPGTMSLSKWPGFKNAEAALEFTDRNKTTFNQRKRLADVLSLKAAQDLGAPNAQAILNELRERAYDNTQWGDSLLVIEFDSNDSLVQLGSDGTKEHMSYEWGIRGKVLGRFARPVNYTLIWDEFFKERRAQHARFLEEAQKEADLLGKDLASLTKDEFKSIKQKLEDEQELKPALEDGDRRSFELKKPVQLITQEIAGRIPQTPYKSIKSPGHAKLVRAFLNNSWKSTAVAKKDGGLGPAEFLDALEADSSKVLLDEYTLKSFSQAQKKSGLKVFQLGRGKVFFGIKNGDPASTYGLDPAEHGFDANEKMLTLVLNAEGNASGMLSAIMIKALEEGVTSLDCYSVPSKKYPNGFLPTLYKQYGFEVTGTIPFDPQYHSATKLADMRKLWKANGWDESAGDPPIVLMKWKGTNEQRQGLKDRYLREGTASFLAGGVGQSDAAAGIDVIGDARTGNARKRTGPDGGRDTGLQGASVRSSDSTRGLAKAAVELRSLTPLELQNLGLTTVEAVEQAQEQTLNQDVFPQVAPARPSPVAGMGAEEISTWAASHSVDEIRQKLASMRLTPTPRMVEMLGAFPEYLDPVVEFLMAQRQKLINGKITAREVAKAYFITLSSIGADAIGVDTIRTRADEIGLEFNPDPMFLSKGAKGQDIMRPEELAAWWFSTPMGQRALNAIEKGTVDKEAWEQGLAIRDAFGRNDARERTSSAGSYTPGMVGEKRKKRNLNDILELTKEINATQGDSAKLQKVLNSIQGIGNGKKGFIGHMLGMGDVATVDAVEINVWLTGSGDTSRLPVEMKKKVALAKAGGTQVGDFYERIRSKIEEVHKKTKAKTNLSDDVAAHIIHHWIWDKAKGAETTHAGVYEAMRYYQRAFHGSPHKFEKFMLDHIGNGEGAQTFGWGLYFAGDREIAEYYRETLSLLNNEPSLTLVKRGLEKVFGESRAFTEDEEKSFVYAAIGSVSKQDLKDPAGSSRREARNLWTSKTSLRDIPEEKLAEAILAIRNERNQGQLYEVEIPDNDVLLDWEKPVPEEIIRKVAQKIVNDGISDVSLEETIEMIEDEYDRNGEILYVALSEQLGGDRQASEFLNSIGIKGIRYLDANSRSKGEGTHNFVIFDDAAIKMLNTFFQRKDNARGSITFKPSERGANRRQFTMRLLKTANESTFIHEAAHYFLETMGELASREGAPEQSRADYAAVMKWLGATDPTSITVEQHETFARSFEAYLMEGKAPAEEVRSLFARMRTWLIRIYRDLTNLNVEMSDEIRGVFDRMVATDTEIQAAEAQERVEPMFGTKPEGMTDQAWERYRKAVEKASMAARESLQARLEKEVLDARTAQRLDEMDLTRAEVLEEYVKKPEYIALHILRFGKMPDDSDIPAPLQAIKLDKESLLYMPSTDEATMTKLRKLGVYRVEGGVSPDAAAQMLGFGSGDELVRALAETAPLKQAVEEETKRRVEAMNPSLLTDREGMQAEAANAVHNEYRDEVIASEMAELQRLIRADKAAVGRVAAMAPAPLGTIGQRILRGNQDQASAAMQLQDPRLIQQIATDMASQILAGMKLRDIRPSLYLAASRRAAMNGSVASAKGNFQTALAAKEQELLNHALHREAKRLQDDAAKQSKYLLRLAAPAAQARLGKAGTNYREQVNAILERFNFKDVPLTQVDRRQRLADWITAQEAAGFTVEIDDAVRDEAFRKDFREMTGLELAAVYEAARQIDHLSKLKNKLLKIREQREFGELMETLVAQVRANTKAKPRQMGSKTSAEQAMESWDGFFAAHRKMASIIREMDGFVDAGPLYWAIIDPINTAGNEEAVETAKATEKLQELFAAYSNEELKRMTKKQVVRGATRNFNLSLEDRLCIALNWGNEDNQRKLVDGYNGLTEGDVLQILDTLTEKDWKFVQSVWDYIDSFWPRSKAKQERVYGIAPEKVQATPVVTKFGTFPGGYYPLKYAGARAEGESDADTAKQMMRGAMVSGTTRRGHLKERVSGVERPIRLDFGVLTQHLTQTIHDLTHHEMLIDVNKILRNRTLMEAIEEHYGEALFRQLRTGLEAVAAGNINSEDRFTRALGHLRGGATIAGLGFNLMTSMQQAFGLTNAIPRVGVKYIAQAVGRWLGSAKDMENSVAWIHSKSNFMRLRGKTQSRDLAEIRSTINPSARTALMDSYFYLIEKGQMLADVPTWLAGYYKAIDEGMTEAQAIALADQTVIDVHGAGQIKDLSAVQRGGPLLKMWSTFYSYFNAAWNLNVELVKKTDYTNPADIGRLMVDMLILNSVPVALNYALMEALRGGAGDDDKTWWKEIAKNHVSYMLGMLVFVRELGGILDGRNYEGPAGGRFFAEAYKLAKQVEQEELDRGFWVSLNKVGGLLFHYPATQAQRTIEGAKSLWEGKTSNPAVLVTGPSKEER